MPLHLLGKKSWNVYKTDNVERVRRDEANAKAREEAEEQRMQEEDSTRRIAILRGEEPAPLLEQTTDENTGKERHSSSGISREHKRKRLRGEDETEREIRYAQEDAVSSQQVKERLASRKGNDAPLLDHAGHIQLVSAPDETSSRETEKNAEYEAEKTKKLKREEDQVTMRFSNAAGYHNGMQKPWYAAASARGDESDANRAVVLAGVEGKDVWGNEDPRRKEREIGRIASNDPFAMMQQAQRQLKQSENDREKWQAEQAKEMRDMERDRERARRREKKHRHHHEDEDLESFSLDPTTEKSSRQSHRHDSHRRHYHRHRHRSRERNRSRERGR